MDSQTIRDAVHELANHILFSSPATGWYFSPESPPSAVEFDAPWECMFHALQRLGEENSLCFSARGCGCRGAAGYLGFREMGSGGSQFLVESEGFKKTLELGDAFYRDIQALPATNENLVLAPVSRLPDGATVEVVNLWVDALSLAGLVTLANYDRPSNDNVRIPFASGCQSVWTIPYQESFHDVPKAVVGVTDPAARAFMPRDLMVFSVPVARLVEMVEYLPGSFLARSGWSRLVGKQAT